MTRGRTGVVARVLLTALLTVLLCAQVAVAHKVNLFGYAEGGFVYVEGYFTDGAPSMGSKVEVYGPKATLVAQGTTGADGKFFFPAQVAGSYRVAMNASMGHGSEITVEVGQVGSPDEVGSAGAYGSKESDATDTAGFSSLAERVDNLTEEVRALRKRVEKPGFAQIVGGLGFIAGMAGAYLWGASRKKG